MSHGPIPILYLQRNAGRSGAPESLLHLIRALDPERFAPHVVCGHEGWLVDTLRAIDIPVFVCPLPGWTKLKSFRAVRMAVARIGERFAGCGIRVVHANEHILAPYAVLLGRRLGAVRVCHVRWHNLNARRLWEYLFPWLDQSIVVSQSAGQCLYRTRATRGKTTTVYNGVDVNGLLPQHDRTEAKRRLELDPADQILLTVGTVCGRKNQSWLLQVMRQLLSRQPRARLLMAGDADPPYAEQIGRLAKTLGISERVHLLGLRHDIPQLLEAADVFVFPTRSEGFPRAILEAMCKGLPVVASDIGANAEAIVTGESGVLVPLGDLNGWVRAIDRLLRRPALYRRLVDGGRARVLERYSAQEIGRRIAGIYERLLAGPAGKRGARPRNESARGRVCSPFPASSAQGTDADRN